MAVPKQEQQFDDSQGRGQERKRALWIRWIIVGIVLILIAVGSTIWLLSGQSPWTTILPVVIFTVLGVMIGLFQWLFPISSAVSAHPTASFSTSSTPQVSRVPSPLSPMPQIVVHVPTTQPLPPESPTANKTAYRGMIGLPPPTDSRSIQQREVVVKEVYAKLTQQDITAIALTGIGGVGKSTLAALVYRYSEEQRRVGNGLFRDDPIWLTVSDSITMADLVGTLFEILGKPMPDLSSLTPHNQAVALFNALNTIDKARLVVLDQFENLLDWQTGYALVGRPGIGEWLDIINSQSCRCRVLFTSRPRPKGTRQYPPTYMQEYPVSGLEITEGMELLRNQGVKGTEAELHTAVTRCAGHAYALMLLASLIRDHNMSLTTLFKDLTLWTGDIASNLLDYIYTQQLSQVQRKLLLAFSIYREPVPLEAAQILADFTAEVPKAQVLSALEALRAQHLLHPSGGGRYQLHAIVVDYAQDHYLQGDEQASRQALQAAHSRAAQYYLHQAAISCPPREKRRGVSDIQLLVEAVWQYCQAGQYQEAFDLMWREWIFSDLKRWGGNTILLELYQLLLPDKWNAKPSQAALVYTHLGRVYSSLGQREQARKHLEQARDIHREIGNRLGEGTTLNYLGRIYDDLGQKERAREYLEQALDIFREVGACEGEAATLNNLGRMYDDLGQKERAMEYYEQSLSKRNEVGDRLGEGRTLKNLGRVCSTLGQKERALGYLMEALSICREVADPIGEAGVLNNLGHFYEEQRQQEKALEYYEQALKVRKDIGDRLAEGRTLKNLGRVYSMLGQEEKAKYDLEGALSILKEVEDRRAEARALTDLGLLYSKKGEKERAWNYYCEALGISREVGSRWGEGGTLQYIGLFYFEQSHYDIALASFLLAKDILEEAQSLEGDLPQSHIETLRKKIGEEQFNGLLARVEPQASQIVEQALSEGLVAREQIQ